MSASSVGPATPCSIELDRRRHAHLGRLAPVSVLANELGVDELHDHGRGGTTLEHFTDVGPDPLERIESLALHVLGQDLNGHPWEAVAEAFADWLLAPMLGHLLLGGF